MVKVYHILKPNKSRAIPEHLVFVDTETFREKVKDGVYREKFRVGWANYVKLDRDLNIIVDRWRLLAQPQDFWSFLKSKCYSKVKLYVFAHNFQFDFPILGGFSGAERQGFKLYRWIFDDDRFILTFRYGSATITFLDTLNLVKLSLEDIGRSVGLEKLKINFESCSSDELLQYCKRDVEIIRKFVLTYIKFIVEHDLGMFKPTIAAQSFTAFKHRFMKCKIFIHANDDAIRLERESYRGGRVECFRLGEFKGEDFYKLDVNSMYPYVAMRFTYPTRLVKYSENVDIDCLKDLLKRYLVIADCSVEINHPAIGVKRNKLIFPVGRFRAVLCTPELQYVSEFGEIHKVHRVSVYEHRNIFKSYIQYFYDLKNRYKGEGNLGFYLISKLFLNSFYGKWGQKCEVWERLEGNGECEYSFERVYDADNGRWLYLAHIGPDTYIKRGEREGFDSFVAIASHITAYARMYLWSLITRAELRNVYYVDTDSLIVNQEGYDNLKGLVDENVIGRLKLEGVTSRLIINNVKDYVFGSEVKVKGVKLRDEKVKSMVSVPGPKKLVQERILRLRGLMNEGIDSYVIVEEYEKNLKRTYDKGIVQDDGSVKPIFLAEF